MNKLKGIVIAGIILIITACSSVTHSTRIQTGVISSVWNSMANSYMERPTHTKLETLSNGKSVLSLKVDLYGGNSLGLPANSITFDLSQSDKYIDHINKFLSWSELARKRGDAIDKEIGSAPSLVSTGMENTLQFRIFSSSSQDHYLVLNTCKLTCSSDKMFFSEGNAIRLKETLNSNKGNVKHLNVDEVYK